MIDWAVVGAAVGGAIIGVCLVSGYWQIRIWYARRPRYCYEPRCPISALHPFHRGATK